MGFSLPTFNLACNIWRATSPTIGPPDVPGVICNLCRGERDSTALAWTPSSGNPLGDMWLLVPSGTDIRDMTGAGGPDVVECPAGTSRFYTVQWVDDAGLGFANEHRFAAILKQSPWPVPFPTTSPTPPPPPSLRLPFEFVYPFQPTLGDSYTWNNSSVAALFTLVMIGPAGPTPTPSVSISSGPGPVALLPLVSVPTITLQQAFIFFYVVQPLAGTATLNWSAGTPVAAMTTMQAIPGPNLDGDGNNSGTVVDPMPISFSTVPSLFPAKGVVSFVLFDPITSWLTSPPWIIDPTGNLDALQTQDQNGDFWSLYPWGAPGLASNPGGPSMTGGVVFDPTHIWLGRAMTFH